MARSSKMHITVVQNGVFRGYIKSVSYAKEKFIITANVAEAKGYATEWSIHQEIDRLTVMGFAYGYIFGYE